MKKHFYSHLVSMESLIVELDQLEFSAEEKHHLARLADSNLHHTILDAIMSELDEEHKQIFMEHLSDNNHDKIWQLLNEKVNNIEDKIKRAAESIKDEMKEDIKEAKKRK